MKNILSIITIVFLIQGYNSSLKSQTCNKDYICYNDSAYSIVNLAVEKYINGRLGPFSNENYTDTILLFIEKTPIQTSRLTGNRSYFMPSIMRPELYDLYKQGINTDSIITELYTYDPILKKEYTCQWKCDQIDLKGALIDKESGRRFSSSRWTKEPLAFDSVISLEKVTSRKEIYNYIDSCGLKSHWRKYPVVFAMQIGYPVFFAIKNSNYCLIVTTFYDYTMSNSHVRLKNTDIYRSKDGQWEHYRNRFGILD